MINKTYRNKETGEVFQVTNYDDIWVQLNNSAKIRKDSFLNKYVLVETNTHNTNQNINTNVSNESKVNPDDFFSASSRGLDNLAQGLKSMDTSNIQDNLSMGTTVKQSPGTNSIVDNSTTSMASSIDDRQKMINEFLEKRKNIDEQLKQYQESNIEEQVDMSNNPNMSDYQQQPKKSTFVTKPKTEEEIVEEDTYKFFKGFKKNHDIVIELKFDEKIADPEFLRLMMNNFEADVIKYYTKEIFKNIASNPDRVEEEIYNQLENAILNKKKPTRKRRTTTKKEEPKVDKPKVDEENNNENE